MNKTKTNWGEIKGNQRIRTHLLNKPEKKLIRFLAPLVPTYIETYHLTLTAIPLGLLLIGTGFLSQQNKLWFLASALIIFLRYLADILDGEIGRRRKTGLVKWGFYTDHFLDFIFSICVISSYLFYLPQNKLVLLLILGTIATHFLNESLICITLGRYQTSGYFGIGPTEIILMTILFSLSLAIFPPTFTRFSLTFFWFITTFGIILKFYRVQKILWKKELGKKK